MRGTARVIWRISKAPRRSAAAPASARWRGSIRRVPSPANIRCCSIRASRRRLLGHFAGAISGSVDRAQDELPPGQARREAVFAGGVTIVDDPLRLRGLRSRPFDGEGVRVSRAGAGVRRRAQQLDRGKRLGAAARDRADRPCRARRRRRARAPARATLHGGRARAAARNCSPPSPKRC